jgi:hypothetical protein
MLDGANYYSSFPDEAPTTDDGPAKTAIPLPALTPELKATLERLRDHLQEVLRSQASEQPSESQP